MPFLEQKSKTQVLETLASNSKNIYIGWLDWTNQQDTEQQGPPNDDW